MWDNKEVGRDHLIVQMVAHYFTDFVCTISFGHLEGEAIDLLMTHGLHEVDKEIVVKTIHSIFSYLFKHLFICIV
jgi:hypothetical protein